jgi:hypothetical protein
MRRFVLGWKQLGYEEGLKARIVNYADDFVILSVNKGQEAYEAMKQMMKKLGLEVNEGKTRLCQQGAGTSAYPDEYLYETLGLVRLEKTTRAERMRIGKGGGSREPPANPTLRCIGKRYRRIKAATRDWAERENQRDQCGASPVLQVSMGTHFSGLAILEVLPTFENLMQASREQP